MVLEAGIEMPETHLLRDGEFAHFMIRRFDRVRDDPTGAFRRLHFHSLGGLQHIDFNDQFVFSYEAYFDTIRAIGLGQRAVNEAFRRMVFSVATVNFDDHVKNFGFLMNPAGRWRLAPAYDVTYAENDAWTRQHQMSGGSSAGSHRVTCRRWGTCSMCRGVGARSWARSRRRRGGVAGAGSRGGRARRDGGLGRGAAGPHQSIWPRIMSTARGLKTSGSKRPPIHSLMCS